MKTPDYTEDVASPHGKHVRLRPCPNPKCRSKAVSVKTLGGVMYLVWCQGCGMTGPEAETAREGASAWNLLRQPVRVECTCGKLLKEGDPESHGICKDCAKELYGVDLDGEEEYKSRLNPLPLTGARA